MPNILENLPKDVPQARLIKQKDSVVKFDIEYTPDSGSYWYRGKYLFF